MKRFLIVSIMTLAICLSFCTLNSFGERGELEVSWDDPQLYDGSLYGTVVVVHGTIVNTYNSGKACFLNFHNNWKKYFTAVIFKSDFHKFETPEDDYYLKRVMVRGILKKYKGKPEIIVKSPEQITILK